MEDRRYHNIADLITFLPTTEMSGEREEARVTARGDGTALQPERDMGWFGSVGVHLHMTLPIPMMTVGPRRLDLATAALGTLQPPSVVPDWELPAQLPVIMDIFTSYAMDHTNTLDSYYGLLASILPTSGFGLGLGKLPDCFTNRLLVSMGEGEIVGTDTTTGYHGQRGLFTTENLTSLAKPLYISPLHSRTWPLQLRS